MTATYTEAEEVLIMRIERFFELGVSYAQAIELAAGSYNLHEAEDLAELGCPPELLYEILT